MSQHRQEVPVIAPGCRSRAPPGLDARSRRLRRKLLAHRPGDTLACSGDGARSFRVPGRPDDRPHRPDPLPFQNVDET